MSIELTGWQWLSLVQSVHGEGDGKISPIEKLILLCLAAHADSKGTSFPSWGRLEKFCCCSRQSIARGLSRLQSLGVITRTRRFDKTGRQTSSRYRLRPDGIKSAGGGYYAETGGYQPEEGEYQAETEGGSQNGTHGGNNTIPRRVSQGDPNYLRKNYLKRTDDEEDASSSSAVPDLSPNPDRIGPDLDSPEEIARTTERMPRTTAEAVDPSHDPFLVREQFTEAWNEVAAKIGQKPIAAMFGPRFEAFRQTLQSPEFAQNWRGILASIPQSDFLCGRKPGLNGGPPFRLTVDWFLRDQNWLKVYEGVFHDRRSEPLDRPLTPMEALRGKR